MAKQKNITCNALGFGILTMLIVTTIIIITAFFVQLSPVATARDVFDASQSTVSEAVMGIVVINERQERLSAAAGEPASSVYARLLVTPALKEVYQAPPEITAAAAVIFDTESRKVLYEKNPESIASIASITKLMTALVALEQEPDFGAEYVITSADRREGGRIFLFPGDRVSVDDLFHASLVGSGNTETIALVHALGMTEADFVARMNAKAAGLGLRRTTFADPVGLDDKNTSTAYELIEIVQAAMSREKIRQAVTQSSYKFITKQGKMRLIESTDALLNEAKNYQIIGGKTGYTASAGFCFAGKFADKNNKHPVVSVVLGSENVTSRFAETDSLVTWVYENHEWR